MDEQEPRDSMGSLLPAKSSENSTRVVALNVKALGSEFAELCSSETVGKALVRLAAVFGEPFGRDRNLMRAMAVEWVEALGDLPAASLNDAVSWWIRTEKRWPKPAEIRAKSTGHLAKAVEQASESTGLHPRRISRDELSEGFVFKRSSLRTNPDWAAFLDSIHPTHEHCFFTKCEIGNYANELLGVSGFERDYITRNWGDKLATIFGRPISFRMERIIGVG